MGRSIVRKLPSAREEVSLAPSGTYLGQYQTSKDLCMKGLPQLVCPMRRISASSCCLAFLASSEAMQTLLDKEAFSDYSAPGPQLSPSLAPHLYFPALISNSTLCKFHGCECYCKEGSSRNIGSYVSFVHSVVQVLKITWHIVNSQ